MKILRLIALFSLTPIAGLRAQPQPAFEVAEIKPSKLPVPGTSQLTESGHLRLTGVSLRLLISGAWRVKKDAVTGGPSWLDSDRFDVVANAPAKTSPADLQLMLRSLLVERFHVAVHTDERMRPVYALTVDKSGPRMKETPEPSDRSGCTGGRENGMAHRVCLNTSMALFARLLPTMSPHYLDMPVENLTGLTGHYDFELTWQPNQLQGKDGGAPTGPTIFDAVRELGLKLESRKLLSTVVIVDKADRLGDQ